MSRKAQVQSLRTARFQKDWRGEELLSAVNQALAPLERELVAAFTAPRYPIIFVVGAPRSGTTMLVQLLITCFELGYINNVAARFWMAPYVGAWLASELHDSERPPAIGFSSDVGITREYEGPHEFGYFWRRWFDYHDTHELSREQIEAIDITYLRQELAAIEHVFDRPILLKNIPALSLQVGFLATAVPESVFIHCRRDHLYVAQSLLLSRLKYYGAKESWFSVKPKEYRWLKSRPYAEQIAGQVFYTQKRIEQAFSSLDSRHCLEIDYESLCQNPQEQLERVANLLSGVGCELSRRDCAVPDLTCTNERLVDENEFRLLEVACRQFFGEPAGE